MNTQVNDTVSHVIAQQLREDILRQRYRADDRLPSERDLAVRFSASRGAVREALSQLEQVGLIRVQPGGARVQPIANASVSILGSLMNLDSLPDPDLVDQFLRVFGTLAALTTREAVAKADDRQIAALQRQVSQIAKDAGDFQKVKRAWRELMENLSAIDDNLVVTLIGNDLRAQFVDRMMTLDIQPQLSKKATRELVTRLRGSLAARDAEQAARAIQTHFDLLRRAVVDVIRSLDRGYQREAV